MRTSAWCEEVGGVKARRTAGCGEMGKEMSSSSCNVGRCRNRGEGLDSSRAIAHNSGHPRTRRASPRSVGREGEVVEAEVEVGAGTELFPAEHNLEAATKRPRADERRKVRVSEGEAEAGAQGQGVHCAGGGASECGGRGKGEAVEDAAHTFDTDPVQKDGLCVEPLQAKK